MTTTKGTTIDLEARCELLRSLHRPGDPLVLPNAWDAATARAAYSSAADPVSGRPLTA